MSGWGKADDKTSTGTVALAAPTATFNGADDVASNTITVTAHPFRNGDKVNYVDGGGTQVVGLVDTTDYFITNATTNTVQLAATQADALHNNPTVITLADGVGASHALTLAFEAGTRGIITGAGGADFEGAGQEAFVGDVIVSGSQSMVILSINSATECIVENLDRGTALTAFSAAQYTLNEKPLSVGADANTSAADVYGVDNTEVVRGSDNVVSIAVNEDGTQYLEVPTVTVAAPTARTVLTGAVTVAADTITITDHNLTTGAKLTYGDGGGTALAGLTDGTTYFVIKVDNDTIQLASNLTNANAGTEITLTGTGNDSQTFTGVTATATATVSGGVVTGFSVTEVGSDYVTAPTVTVEVPTRTIPTSGVNTGTDVITYTGHGLSVDDRIRYQDGGSTALAGLTDNTIYYVESVPDADTFKVSATEGGSAIDLTGTGNNAQFFELLDATQATANASLGLGAAGDQGSSAAHSGWVKRTVGTGARAGRVQYEVLVALSKNGITGDAADDTELPES